MLSNSARVRPAAGRLQCLARISALPLIAMLAIAPACKRKSPSAEPHTVKPAAEFAQAPGSDDDDGLVEGVVPSDADQTRTATKPSARKTTKPKTTKTASAAKKTSSPASKQTTATAKTASKTPARPTPAPAARPVAPAKPAATPKRVSLPSTAHVRYVVGSGMQKLVDKDPRIVTWLRKITPVLDRCYRGLSGSPKGTVKVSVTMHENRRPSAGLKTLPSSLAGLMPCATMKLMSTRAPMFTGPEGQRHTVSIQFK